MRKRPVGLVLVVGGIALTAGVALSMVRTAGGAPSGDPSAIENALRLPPTTTTSTIQPPETAAAPETSTLDNAATPDAATAPPDIASDGSDTSPTVSPFESSLQVRSGTEALRRTSGPEPTSLSIPRIDVTAQVDPYGVAPNGQMDVPDNVTDVGWYEFGPAPGSAGSSVLAAHVDLASQGRGVFFDLKELEAGDQITVGYDDGSTADFRVVARTTYDKDELPLDVIFARSGPPVLTLVTCGGGFSESARSYDSNVVVYAVPDSGDHPGTGVK